MNDKDTHHDELHLHADPQIERIESLLDTLGRRERDAMSPGVETRVLESVSRVFAPEPISIADASPAQQVRPRRRWSPRLAAAAAIALVATLSVVVVKPWASSTPGVDSPNTPAWSLASFEEDLDAYLSLDEQDDDQIDEAVANWELWAQTIESDFAANQLDSDLGITGYNDGAL